ncbi:Fatty acid synthase subunit alpha [Trichinella pseudospiralis]
MGPQTYRVLHHERKRRTLVVAVEDLPGLDEVERWSELDEKIDTAHAGTGQKSESAVDARSRSKLFARVLEDWHDRLNSKAANGHNGLYELLQILIAEQGVMETLIQLVLSGEATVD